MDKIILHSTFSTNLIAPSSARFSCFPLRFAVRKVTYNASFIGTYHYHDFPQVWYCEKGSYRHLIDGKSEICNEGSFVIIPPGVYHGYEIFPDCETTLICIEGTFSYFKTLSEPYRTLIISRLFLCRFSLVSTQILKTVMNFHNDEKGRLDALLRSLYSYDYYSSIDEPSEIEALLIKLFSFPQFYLPEERLPYYRSVIENKLAPLVSACGYLHKNYPQKIYSKDLVKMSALCQSEFFKYFKIFTGTTYSLYLQAIRIRHAAHLCFFSTFSFNYISDMCGFGNITYMEKLLKKYYGRSAGQLRKSVRESDLYDKYKILTHDYVSHEYEFY